MDGRAVVVYWDIAFVLFFTLDLIWFWVTGRMAGVRIRWWRLFLAAALGALAGVWALYPSGWWIGTIPAILVGTLLLLALAYWPVRLRQAIGLVTALVGVYAGALGMEVLLALWVGHRSSWGGFVQAMGVMLGLAGGHYLSEIAHQRLWMTGGLYRLQVCCAGRMVEVPAFLDTGNDLRDPFSGDPVVVVEARALAEVLPEALLIAAQHRTGEALWDRLAAVPEAWADHVRAVPFRAVGQPSGLLVAFEPDRLYVQRPGQTQWREVRGLVGLAAVPLKDDCRALLPPRMLL